MIFGASGGIGHLAVQFAKRMGARVFAVASGSDGVALVKRLGADVVIDGHKDDIVAAARQFAPNGFDAALITAGGPAADKALGAMRPGGRVAYPNGVEPTPEPRSGIEAKAMTGCPTRRRSRNSIGLSNLRGRREPGRSRSMLPEASRLTKPPKRIGRLMSTILASSPSKRPSRSHTGCATMPHRRVRTRL